MSPYAVAHLDEGVQSWNNWRHENPGSVDLRAIDLSGRDLSLADLRFVDLRGAVLRETTLTGSLLGSASLSSADLSGAALNRADLSNADARGAYFMYSSARHANLRKTNLNGANLTGTDLQGANLDSAILLETVIVDANLCGAQGLEECDQPGPSIVDYRTVIRSNGLPATFLRRSGLPDEVIETYSRFKYGAVSCFLSYSSKDEAFARRLYSALQKRGVRCWFAPEDLPIGGRIRPIIDSEIRQRDRFLVVLSTNSVNSSWVEKEVETAFERAYKYRSPFLMPLRVDDAVMETGQAWAADLRRSFNIGDFRNWEDSTQFESALERLLRDFSAVR